MRGHLGERVAYAGILTVGGESVRSTESIESSMNILDLQRSTVREGPQEDATSKPSLVSGDWPGTTRSRRAGNPAGTGLYKGLGGKGQCRLGTQ